MMTECKLGSFSSRNSKTEFCRLWKLFRQFPFDNHRTSVCKSNQLKYSSFSMQSSLNTLSFKELLLILFTVVITNCRDLWSFWLRFLATRCWRWMTQWAIIMAGFFFLIWAMRPLYQLTMAEAPPVATARILDHGMPFSVKKSTSN